MDYKTATNEELNRAAWLIENPSGRVIVAGEGKWLGEIKVSEGYGPRVRHVEIPDYCNSWSDAGPIITDHKITIGYDDTKGYWTAMRNYGQGCTQSITAMSMGDDPLRCAMTVFLMMEGK